MPQPDDISWRDYVDVRFAAIENAAEKSEIAVHATLVAKEKVDEQTAEALKIRLESMNEFRAQINSERGSYVTKDTLDALLKPLQTKQTTAGGFANGAVWVIGGLGWFVAIIVPIILFLLKSSIK